MAQGLEVLIGVVNDASFGPAVALGLGGVLAEVLKDVTHRIAPFDLETARDMIAELRAAPPVRGLSRQTRRRQGSPGAHAGGRVADGAGARARACARWTSIPLFVGPPGQGLVAADALIVLR